MTTRQIYSEELICHLCGCEESAHGGTDIIDGEETEVCTGCGEPCTFEPEDEEDDEEDEEDEEE